MWDWIKRNRTLLGGLLVVTVGYLQLHPEIFAGHPTVEQIFVLIAGLVLGGGVFKSDKYHRDKQGVVKIESGF